MSVQNDFEMEDGHLKRYCGQDADVAVPDGVSVIESEAFEGYDALQSITLPEGLLEIGFHAFANCHHLERVTFPSSLVTLGSCAFQYCESLKAKMICNTLNIIIAQ